MYLLASFEIILGSRTHTHTHARTHARAKHLGEYKLFRSSNVAVIKSACVQIELIFFRHWCAPTLPHPTPLPSLTFSVLIVFYSIVFCVDCCCCCCCFCYCCCCCCLFGAVMLKLKFPSPHNSIHARHSRPTFTPDIHPHTTHPSPVHPPSLPTLPTPPLPTPSKGSP